MESKCKRKEIFESFENHKNLLLSLNILDQKTSTILEIFQLFFFIMFLVRMKNCNYGSRMIMNFQKKKYISATEYFRIQQQKKRASPRFKISSLRFLFWFFLFKFLLQVKNGFFVSLVYFQKAYFCVFSFNFWLLLYIISVF